MAVRLMIDFNQPEPVSPYCIGCGRQYRLLGTLIHWPSASHGAKPVMLPDGTQMEPFSLWVYQCAWCRGAQTKRRNRARSAHKAKREALRFGARIRWR